MNSDDRRASPEDDVFAERLASEPPRPSPALRRRVRDSIGVAFGRQALRRRAALLAVTGVVCLIAAAGLAVTMPT